MELSSIEFLKIISALNKEIEGYYLNNVYQIMENSYLLKCHHPEKSKKFILINPKIGIWSSKYEFEKLESTGYVTSLRKNLTRAKLLKFEQPPGERICIIHFKTEKGIRKLVCEFFREGNIIVIDDNDKILSCLSKLIVRHREIFPGSLYKLPPSKGINLENFNDNDLEKIKNSNIEIAKWLGRNYSISRKYVEEILSRINIDYNKICNKLTEIEINEISNQIKELVKIINSKESNAWIYKENDTINDISLIELKSSKSEKYEKTESLMKALDNLITSNLSQKQVITQQKSVNKKVIELEKTIQLQEEAYKTNVNLAKILRLTAIELSKSNSYEEVLQDQKIEFSKSKNNLIKIPIISTNRELEEEIKPIKLSSIFFNKAKTIEKKIEAIENATKKLKINLDNIKNKIDNQKDRTELKEKEELLWFERYRWFITSEGILAIGGRDSHSNSAIIRKHTKSNDLVFHSEIIGSPFFILKDNASDLSIQEVAMATGSFSRAWRTQIPVDVYFVKPEQVKKGAPSGSYLPKGSFLIEGKKNMIKNIKPEIAIGAIKYENKYTIMSGPVKAIKVNSLAIVIIKPGKRKSSEIAKIVKQKLIAKLDSNLSEIYKNKPLDDFLRILPAGGSELVEKRE